MKSVIRALGMLAGLGLLASGCVNLAGANLSNIGNGNSLSANVHNVGNGNSANGSVNVGPGGNPGPMNQGPQFSSVSLSRTSFTLFRLPAGTDINSLFNQNMGPNPYPTLQPTPTPSFLPYPGNLSDLMFQAAAQALNGGTMPIFQGDPQWIWNLPAGVQIVPTNQPGSTSLALLATSTAATGSFEMSVSWAADPKVKATASVVVTDQGAANVVIE